MSILKWVKVQKYCELSGDTLEGVRAKRRKRIWTEGVHWSRPADGVFYINIEEVSKWVENQSPSERLAA